MSIFASDGTDGGPGTLLQEITFDPISMTAGSVNTYTFTPGSAIFTAPSDGFFWAGMSFDNGGTSTATVADLNNLGMGLFDPPTVGSSEDGFFQSDNSRVVGTGNPAGDFYYFGGDPVANFGWLFSGVSATGSAMPEPASLLLLLPIVATMAGVVVYRQRRPIISR